MYFFYLMEKTFKFLLHTVQVLYMCTLCGSTNINTTIEFVPNCLQYVSGDGLMAPCRHLSKLRSKRRNA